MDKQGLAGLDVNFQRSGGTATDSRSPLQARIFQENPVAERADADRGKNYATLKIYQIRLDECEYLSLCLRDGGPSHGFSQ